jgi:TolB protein
VRFVAGADLALTVAISLVTLTARADREPVLAQVDVPHSYYWRELYLPQLTTGPSSAAFLPDGRTLVVSEAGSLWRESIDTREATELTHADAAYDYQPDVDRAGDRVVFSRYDGRAIELWLLDLRTGEEHALTRDGAVNVEARFSPDGRRLAWVSTRRNGRFDLFVAGIEADRLVDAHPLFPERRSTLDRYYYSPWDHAINPSWSADGRRLYYVGNPEVVWGSGDIWSVAVDAPQDPLRIVREETTWSARPEESPDGHRVLYSSYHGRAWHQLWITTPAGAPPLPLTFGEFDRRDARWSPDGERIACISNEQGNTALVVRQVVGGAEQPVVVESRRYLRPQARLTIDVRNATGQPLPARISVIASDGRAYAPQNAWMHADDGFDRSLQATENHYFHCTPPCEVAVPAGRTTVEVHHGSRDRPWQRTVTLAAGGAMTLTASLERADLPAEFGRFVSADLHVHMNYGGHYRATPERLVADARAEDLDVVYNLIVNKEERIPDLVRFRPDPDPAGTDGVLLLHAQEYHTSYWGHTGLLNLSDHLVLPDFASYRHTGLASPYPYNGVIADLAHAQGALFGYVHPFDWDIDPAKETALSHELPADVAQGKVDYLEVVGFSDHRSTAAVWYRLLNLGFHLPAGAGTDAMTNYASLRGPVGLNRVYLDTEGERTPQAVRAALLAGRTFATNGPLLGLTIDGLHPGGTLHADGPVTVPYRVALRSPVPVDHLELVSNGRVLRSLRLSGKRTSLDTQGDIELPASGWIVLRAWNEHADPGVMDLYPYATTSPVYLELTAPAPRADDDARYFVAWLERVIEAAAGRDDYDNERERTATLDYLRSARERYAAMIHDVGNTHP